MKYILLGQRKSALVDDEDFEMLSQYKWHFHNGYARKSNPKIYMHRFLIDPKENMEVDHINNNPLDNRRCNLRECTPSENSANQRIRKDNTSGYRGVSWDKSKNKWTVQITFKHKSLHVGRFKEKLDAVKAYNAKAIDIFGEFAKVNEV